MRQIAVIWQPKAELSTEDVQALFWGNSRKAKNIIANRLRKEMVGEILFDPSAFGGDSAHFTIKDASGIEEHQIVASGLYDLYSALQDLYLDKDDDDKLIVLSSDTGFPMFEVISLDREDAEVDAKISEDTQEEVRDTSGGLGLLE